MSRSGYNEDYDGDEWSLIRWRGAVTSAIRGRRGQAFLKDLLAALDALPEQKLIKDELQYPDGSVCALGALGKARGINMSGLDPCDDSSVSHVFGIAPALAREIVFENDDCGSGKETPEYRFHRMRRWVVAQIKEQAT